jgi:N-acetylglucosamine-1-phosphodiester alpha-N-acetylglucosaminidase
VINGATVTVYVSEIYDPINFFHFVAAPKPYRKKKYSAFIEQQAIIQATNSIDSSTAPTPSSFLSVSSSYGPYNELCDGTAKTSVTSKYHDCDIAMNVGFFDMASGRCFGNLVSRGLIRSVAKGVFAGKCNVGITKNHNYIFGYLNSEDIQHSTIDPHHASTTPITGHVEEEDGGLLELSSGNGWLIRSGHTYLHDAIINEALDNNFINIKAPRNAIGITNNGTLLMLQVDGEEDIKQGLDLYEWTDLLLHHYQLYQAVNVDGGGSSTTIYKNKVVNKPTCVDTPLICERAVTTVACVKQF